MGRRTFSRGLLYGGPSRWEAFSMRFLRKRNTCHHSGSSGWQLAYWRMLKSSTCLDKRETSCAPLSWMAHISECSLALGRLLSEGEKTCASHHIGLEALRQGCALQRPSKMVTCARCQEGATSTGLMEPKLVHQVRVAALPPRHMLRGQTCTRHGAHRAPR